MPISKSRVKLRHECDSTEWIKHPEWPHIELGNNGDVYDSKLGRLRIQCNQGDYPGVQIDGKFRCIHQLMGQTWLGVPKYAELGQVARHLDGNPQNNNVSNLALGTQLENMYDKMLHAGNKTHMHCPYPLNHVKFGANLTANQRKVSVSNCRACQNARSYANNKGWKLSEEQFKVLADSYYEKCIAETWGIIAHLIRMRNDTIGHGCRLARLQLD